MLIRMFKRSTHSSDMPLLANYIRHSIATQHQGCSSRNAPFAGILAALAIAMHATQHVLVMQNAVDANHYIGA